MKRIVTACICVGCFWVASAQAALVTYFGEDRGTVSALIASHPNSKAQQTSFLSMLVNPVNESFEGFTSGTSVPAGGLRVFNSLATTSATLTGSGAVDSVQQFQRFPEDGNNYLKTTFPSDGSGSVPITIAFDNPIAAFGFFAIDVGDQGGNLIFTMSDGITQYGVDINGIRCATSTALCTAPTDGSILYLGAYEDSGLLFSSVTLASSTPTFDRFTYDSMTVAPQVVPLPPSVLLLFSGLSGMFLLGRRKTKQS